MTEEEGVQLERVKRLREEWKKVDPETVELDTWKCDTFACLGGHAAQMKTFQKEGFVLEESKQLFGRALFHPRYKEETGLAACYKFFGGRDIFECKGDC